MTASVSVSRCWCFKLVPVVSGWWSGVSVDGLLRQVLESFAVAWHGLVDHEHLGRVSTRNISTLERSKLEGVKIRSTLGLKKMSWSMGWGHRGSEQRLMIVAGQHTGVGGSRRMYQINTSNAICRIWLLGSDHFAGQSILCIL
jgi:hypothetical protein